MRNYLVSGFLVFGGGSIYPLSATATLEDHEVMDLTTLTKIQQLLLEENNRSGRIANSLRVTAFQPYETHQQAAPSANPDVHLNECGTIMPPVNSPLLIEIAPGVLLQAIREDWAQSRADQLIFKLDDGASYIGRPRWTHP